LRIIIIAALCFIATYFTTSACSCIEVNIKSGVSNSSVILTGEIIGEVHQKVEYDTMHYEYECAKVLQSGGRLDTLKLEPNVRLEFEKTFIVKVLKIFKGGISADTILVTTPSHGASCGNHYVNGKQYIMYSHRTSEYKFNGRSFTNIHTSLCSRTQRVNDKEIALLERELMRIKEQK